MPSEFAMWVVMGTLALATMVAFTGWLGRKSRGVMPPPLPLEAAGRGLAFGKVDCRFYGPIDLVVVAMILGLYLFPLLLGIFGKLPDKEVELGVGAVVGTILTQVFFLAMVLAVMWWRVKPPQWLGLGWPGTSGAGWLSLFLMVPVAVLSTIVLASVMDTAGLVKWIEGIEGGDGRQEVVKAFTETDSPLMLGLLSLVAVVVAPVTEEVIFRGYLYPVMKRFTGQSAGILVSALLFAAVHHNAVAILPLAWLAILLAMSYEWTGSIWAPIAIHATFNSITVIAQFAQRSGVMEMSS